MLCLRTANRLSCCYLTSIRFLSRTAPRKFSSQLWRPAAFTLFVGCSSYAVSIFIYDSRKHKIIQKDLDSLSEPSDRSTWIKKIKQWWQYQYYQDKFFYTLLAVNTCVFLTWRVRRLHSVMLRYFLSSPTNSATSSLLLCSFSHMEVWHFLINMFVLWSFIPPFIAIVGREVSWPFYITAGTFAAMVSHYSKLMRGFSSLPSLGASGALLAIASLVVLHHPEATLYIIFLPFIPIPAYMGLSSIIALDVIGLIRGWKIFDHAAHLGGVVFGLSYYQWGHDLLIKCRPRIRQFIRNITKSFR